MSIQPTMDDIAKIKAAWDRDIAAQRAENAALRTALVKAEQLFAFGVGAMTDNGDKGNQERCIAEAKRVFALINATLSGSPDGPISSEANIEPNILTYNENGPILLAEESSVEAPSELELAHFPRRDITGDLEIVDRRSGFVRARLPYDYGHTCNAQQWSEATRICQALEASPPSYSATAEEARSDLLKLAGDVRWRELAEGSQFTIIDRSMLGELFRLANALLTPPKA